MTAACYDQTLVLFLFCFPVQLDFNGLALGVFVFRLTSVVQGLGDPLPLLS